MRTLGYVARSEEGPHHRHHAAQPHRIFLHLEGLKLAKHLAFLSSWRSLMLQPHPFMNLLSLKCALFTSYHERRVKWFTTSISMNKTNFD
jgi:hypothetical protein